MKLDPAQYTVKVAAKGFTEAAQSIDLRETGFFLARVVERALRMLADAEKGLAHAR